MTSTKYNSCSGVEKISKILVSKKKSPKVVETWFYTTLKKVSDFFYKTKWMDRDWTNPFKVYKMFRFINFWTSWAGQRTVTVTSKSNSHALRRILLLPEGLLCGTRLNFDVRSSVRPSVPIFCDFLQDVAHSRHDFWIKVFKQKRQTVKTRKFKMTQR